jgi:hypothetical protein
LTVDTQDAGTGTPDAGAPQNADGPKPDATGATDAAAQAAADAAKGPVDAAAQAATDAAKAANAEYKFTAPEGIELDAAQVADFSRIAKELKLPAEAAQKIVDIAAGREVARAEAHRTQVAKWAEDVSKDKDIGTPEAQAAARGVIDTYGTLELKALLNSTGLGNHPELVRMVAKIGKAMSEDSIRGKGDAGAKPSDHASILYGTPAKS